MSISLLFVLVLPYTACSSWVWLFYSLYESVECVESIPKLVLVLVVTVLPAILCSRIAKTILLSCKRWNV